MNQRKYLFISLMVLSLISCNFVTRLFRAGTKATEIIVTATPEITGKGSPEVINHPKPDLTTDIQPFIDAGCGGENLYVMECAADSPLRTLGCDFLSATTLSGGLDPPYPAAICLRRESSGEPPDPSSFKMTGCLMPLYQAVIVAVDGEFRLVSDPDDFQAYFEPIESEDEALSYAQLVTGLNAVYGREVAQESSYIYRVDRIEDTHVVKTDEGYVVNLFSGAEPLCGCGTHTFYQRDVLVQPDGQVGIIQSTPLYDLEACID
jgi:hypothetical protein